MSSPADPQPGADGPAPAVPRGSRVEAVAWRLVLFAGLWVVIAGADPADWPGMALGVLAATAASLALLPPMALRLRPVVLLRLAGRFALQSVSGGLDVGWRALHPRVPLRPGLRTHVSRLPAGTPRDVLRALASAVPGVLPCGQTAEGALVVHCLDDDEAVDAALGADEALFLALIARRR